MKETTLPHDHGEHNNFFNLQQYLDNSEDFQIIAEVFKQLGDPTRIRIFWLLCHYEECVLNIAAIMNMSSPAVSHHLKSLKSSDLIVSRRDGKEVYYRSSDTPQCKLLHEMIEQVMKISCPVSEDDSCPEHMNGHEHSNGCEHMNGHVHSNGHEYSEDCENPHSSRNDFHLSSGHADDFHASHCSCCREHDSCSHHGQYQEEQIQIIHNIHNLLTEHIEKRWTVEELSKQFLMNPTTLKSLFKSVYGNSLATHIKEHRMEKAARLLSDTDLSLADIASTVGYNSQSKFTAAFKEYYLSLPKDYRKQHRKSGDAKALVILAGGKSSRMGKDKTFLTYKGISFLETLLIKACSEFDRIIIAAGSREHAAAIYNHINSSRAVHLNLLPEIIIDKYKEIGPMGGLMSVFEQTGLNRFAVTAIDLPKADMKTLSILSDELSLSRNDSICAVMLSSSNGKIEPCAAAYNKKAYNLFAEGEKNGSYGIMKILGDKHIQVIPADSLAARYPQLSKTDYDSAFSNINTSEAYAELESK